MNNRLDIVVPLNKVEVRLKCSTKCIVAEALSWSIIIGAISYKYVGIGVCMKQFQRIQRNTMIFVFDIAHKHTKCLRRNDSGYIYM